MSPLGASTASSSSPRAASDLEQARPQTSGEEELQLQLALAMSREESKKVEYYKIHTHTTQSHYLRPQCCLPIMKIVLQKNKKIQAFAHLPAAEPVLSPVTIAMDETHNLPPAPVRHESKEGLHAGSKHTPRLLVFYFTRSLCLKATSQCPLCVSLTSSAVQGIVRSDRK